jgi:lipopolysaccharide/colanic/teichoic acid biosynthesis glycosyltransferase
MSERLGQIYDSLDKKFRSPNGGWAKACSAISPQQGEEYFKSWQKRLLVDVGIGGSMAIATAPLVLGLAVIKKIEDGDGAFLSQARVKNCNETFTMYKLRSMTPVKQSDIESTPDTDGRNHFEHPRATKFGLFLRRFHLDELPQLFQVLWGTLSMVGNRPVLPKYSEYLSKIWSKKRFDSWITNYGKSKSGVTGVYQVFGPKIRNEKSRYHMDMFHTGHASLGFDLYILWRTIRRELES